MKSLKTVLGMAAGLLLALPSVAQAQVTRVTKDDFVAGSGLITFSEKPVGTVNPTYVAADYGGGPDGPTVTFDGFFNGQSLGAGCGGVATGCVVGSPTGPLTLNAASPNASIVNDGAAPNSPVLSGSPTFNGPIGILFDRDLAGVGFDAGFFNAIGGTAVTAYGADGRLLGSVSNTGLGIEFLGLVTNDGSEQIRGVLFSLVGNEPAGFAIDSLRFGRRGQVVAPNAVPEPSTWAMLILGFGALGGMMRQRKQQARVAYA
ncbi:PEPxxWA-CTERM sorting domain-containing protein [Qipengyuania sediminis]|uniref:PEPxxWA-CTERM sorting domain-containing protein n=1 Tax=Qipengyuania sediminis TaxID=1532023 RepID=UPI001059EC34|nr:PEPxxWA-CTERM sorting domain-containing protein [Qipengyuania sediminis]